MLEKIIRFYSINTKKVILPFELKQSQTDSTVLSTGISSIFSTLSLVCKNLLSIAFSFTTWSSFLVL